MSAEYIVGNATAIHKIKTFIQNREICQFLGPNFRGKTKILARVTEELKSLIPPTFEVHHLKLSELSRTDRSAFFSDLFQRIARKEVTSGVWDSAQKLQNELSSIIHAPSTHPTALILDEMEQIPPNWILDLLSAVYGAYDEDKEKKLALVTCSAIGLYHFQGLSPNKRFEPIRFDDKAPRIYVEDLNLDERQQAVRVYFEDRGIPVEETGIETLLKHTGGDYFLIRELCQSEAAAHVRKLTADLAKEIIAEYVGQVEQGDKEKVRALLLNLERNQEVLNAALQILEHGDTGIRPNELLLTSEKSRVDLNICGFFSEDNSGYKIKCPLWKELLEWRLNPLHIGQIYALRGQWSDAYKHLNKALKSQVHGARNELFSTTLIAMLSEPKEQGSDLGHFKHASVELEKGLRVFLNNSTRSEEQEKAPPPTPSLYQLVDEKLILIFPESQPASSESQIQEENYRTIFSFDDHTGDVIIPLRPDGLSERTIGILRIQHWLTFPLDTPKHEEVLQLITFLNKAALILELKQTRDNEEEEEKRRLEMARRLNNVILPEILNYLSDGLETIYKLILLGITSHWGLGFNNAILFIPSKKDEKTLNGHLCVGHFTKKSWERHVNELDHEDFKGFIESLLKEQHISEIQPEIKKLSFKITKQDNNPIINSYTQNKSFLCKEGEKIEDRDIHSELVHTFKKLDCTFQVAKECALVPLRAGEREVFGVIYVDNAFTMAKITEELRVLLQIFVDQSGLIVKNAEYAEKLRVANDEFIKNILQEPIEYPHDQEMITSIDEFKAPLEASLKEIENLLQKDGHNPTRLQFTHLGSRRTWQRYIIKSDKKIEPPHYEPVEKRYNNQSPGYDFDDAEFKLEDPLSMTAYRQAQEQADDIQRFHPDKTSWAIPVSIYNNCMGVIGFETERPFETKKIAQFKRDLTPIISQLAVDIYQIQVGSAYQNIIEIGKVLTRLAVEVDDPHKRKKELFRLIIDQGMALLPSVGCVTLYAVEDISDNSKLQLGHSLGVVNEEQLFKQLVDKDPILERIRASSESIFADDVRSKEVEFLNGKFVARECIKSTAALPLRANGKDIGCIFFSYRHKHHFTNAERKILQMFAQLAAFAVLQAHLQSETEEERNHLRTVNNIAQNVVDETDETRVFEAILEELMGSPPELKPIPANHACVAVWNQGAERLQILESSLKYYPIKKELSLQDADDLIGKSGGLAYKAVREGVTQICAKVQDGCEGYIELVEGTKSEICVPIILPTKARTLAVLVLESQTENAFTPHDTKLLEMLAIFAAIAVQNVRHHAETQQNKIKNLAVIFSHDVRDITPFMPGLIDQLEQDMSKLFRLKSVSKTDTQLKNIRTQFNRVKRRIEELNELSTNVLNIYTRGKLENERIILDRVVREVVESVSDLQNIDKIEVHYKPSDFAYEIVGDEFVISSVLRNLLKNAFKYTRKHRKAAEICIRGRKRSNKFIITVSDNGEGIPDEKKATIFESDPLRPLHHISLPWSKEGIENHGGTLRFRSQVGQGTVFMITLPLDKDDEEVKKG